MQYLTIIACLAATLSGTEALAIRGSKSQCSSGNFNPTGAKWLDEWGSGYDGSILTAQQVCTDVKDKAFTGDKAPDNEHWACVEYNQDQKLKFHIQKTGTEEKLDEAWCKDVMKAIVDDCLWGGQQEDKGWLIEAHASKSECGK